MTSAATPPMTSAGTAAGMPLGAWSLLGTLFLPLLLALLVALPHGAWAAELQIPMWLIDGEGVAEPIGSLMARDSETGLVLVPDLQGLPPGEHGFHLHGGSSCGAGLSDGVRVAGLAAGGHWDPDHAGHHLGPDGPGHRGDLSRLVVAADGRATAEVRAPRLQVRDLAGRALIVHAGGDTYSDTPPLGGGGARIACGLAA